MSRTRTTDERLLLYGAFVCVICTLITTLLWVDARRKLVETNARLKQAVIASNEIGAQLAAGGAAGPRIMRRTPPPSSVGVSAGQPQPAIAPPPEAPALQVDTSISHIENFRNKPLPYIIFSKSNACLLGRAVREKVPQSDTSFYFGSVSPSARDMQVWLKWSDTQWVLSASSASMPTSGSHVSYDDVKEARDALAHEYAEEVKGGKRRVPLCEKCAKDCARIFSAAGLKRRP